MNHKDAMASFTPTIIPGVGAAANVVPISRAREDVRSSAEESAWNEFLALTREMVDAQNRMHEAHKRYLAIKYPKGVRREF